MPLSEPVQRDLLHQRDIQVWGYHRSDGLFDIEGRLTDTKRPASDDEDRHWLPPGAPLHGMWMRLTIDEAMTIVASEACTDFGPYATCPDGAASYGRLVGLTIKAGFLRAANERIGGVAGCTHTREMLQQMATTAFQTLWPVRARRAAEARQRRHAAGHHAHATKSPDSDGAARLLNSCYAYASDGAVVKQRWPYLYSGRDAGQPGGAVALPDGGERQPQLTAATSRES
jgi:hypothetical protein